MTEELIIENAGAKLYVRKRGKGRPLLLIHGVACDCDFYEEAAGLLAGEFTVITYDRRGYSRSKCSDDEMASVTCQADDAAVVLKSIMGSAEHAADDEMHQLPIIAGTSAGGIIAIEFARKYPELTGALFLYEAAYAVSEEMIGALSAWKAKLEDTYSRKSLAACMLRFLEVLGPLDREAPERSIEDLQNSIINLERFLKFEMESMLDYSDRNRGLKLQIPIICGAGAMDKDTLFYRMMHETADKWEAKVTDLEGCHNLAQDRPETFAGWILSNADQLMLK